MSKRSNVKDFWIFFLVLYMYSMYFHDHTSLHLLSQLSPWNSLWHDVFCMSNIGTLPAARPSHFISLVCFVLLFLCLSMPWDCSPTTHSLCLTYVDVEPSSYSICVWCLCWSSLPMCTVFQTRVKLCLQKTDGGSCRRLQTCLSDMHCPITANAVTANCTAKLKQES